MIIDNCLGKFRQLNDPNICIDKLSLIISCVHDFNFNFNDQLKMFIFVICFFFFKKYLCYLLVRILTNLNIWKYLKLSISIFVETMFYFRFIIYYNSRYLCFISYSQQNSKLTIENFDDLFFKDEFFSSFYNNTFRLQGFSYFFQNENFISQFSNGPLSSGH